jgi:hypothetical protein
MGRGNAKGLIDIAPFSGLTKDSVKYKLDWDMHKVFHAIIGLGVGNGSYC